MSNRPSTDQDKDGQLLACSDETLLRGRDTLSLLNLLLRLQHRRVLLDLDLDLLPMSVSRIATVRVLAVDPVISYPYNQVFACILNPLNRP